MRKKLKCLTGTHLKLIAMVCMLIDHMWATVIPGNPWMNCVGRIAFPIFAFQVAEGYSRTSDFKRYLKRMFLFALISELPYNLMHSGGLIYPFSQNVMFTFCLSLLALRLVDKGWQKSRVVGVLAAAGCAAAGYFVGMFTFVDYYGFGILMVLVFHLFRGKWWSWAAQLIALVYINFEMIGGLSIPLFGSEWVFPVQGFAVLALIPIWLYNGQRGRGGKGFQYAVYAFYPVHMLILSLIGLFLI